MATDKKKKKQPNMKIIKLLSKFILLKFIAKDRCRLCWGLAIQTLQTFSNSDFIYRPCTCLKHKKEIKDETTAETPIENRTAESTPKTD